MTAPERVVLLVGSGKAPAAADVGTDQRRVRPHRRGLTAQGSTSEALGIYLLNALGKLGLACETLRVQRCLRSEEARRGMLAAVREASLVLLSFPLYWDALPAALTRSLELISEDRRSNPPVRTQRLATIVNCGFPEASRCEAALSICRQFARETGLVWAGGLALGGGGTISGRHLEKLGRRVRHVARALELSAAALVAGQPVPPAAARLMARPIVSPFAYRFVGNMLWRWHAKAFGAYSRLHDRPYER